MYCTQRAGDEAVWSCMWNGSTVPGCPSAASGQRGQTVRGCLPLLIAAVSLRASRQRQSSRRSGLQAGVPWGAGVCQSDATRVGVLRRVFLKSTQTRARSAESPGGIISVKATPRQCDAELKDSLTPWPPWSCSPRRKARFRSRLQPFFPMSPFEPWNHGPVTVIENENPLDAMQSRMQSLR